MANEKKETGRMAKRGEGADGVTIIKKYANRRLYNTASSSYITLDDLAKMTRDGVDFKVLDAKSGEDITHAILTQIIMEEESSGEQMLPVSFLRQLISMYGNSMQAMMPAYLEAMMANFRDNQAKLQETLHARAGSNPFAKIAETNLAMMRAATETLIPRRSDKPSAGASQSRSDELAELRAQMAAIQQKLDALGK